MPARPLKAAELAALERAIETELDSRDVYMIGATIFAVLSRSRWSDLKHVHQFWIEREWYDGQLYGFVEARTQFHKETVYAIGGTTAWSDGRGLVQTLDGVLRPAWSGHLSGTIWGHLQGTESQWGSLQEVSHNTGDWHILEQFSEYSQGESGFFPQLEAYYA